MNPLASSTGATERSPLVEQLARRADGNRDGQVTSAEFASFLSGLMASLDGEQAARQEPEAPPSAAATGDPSPVLLPLADGGTLTRAQGAALLRQAFEPLTRSR